jgi:CRP-like cAMP-binding protein
MPDVQRYLKQDLNSEINFKTIMKCSFLRCNFSRRFLRELSPLLEVKYYNAEEKVIQQGSTDDSSLMIIADGKVQLSDYRNLHVLSRGDFFGERGLVTSQNRTATATCAENCKLYKLSRVNFLSVIRHFPYDFVIDLPLRVLRSSFTISEKMC